MTATQTTPDAVVGKAAAASGVLHQPWCAYEDSGACRNPETDLYECAGDDQTIRPTLVRSTDHAVQQGISAYLQAGPDSSFVCIEPEGHKDGDPTRGTWELTGPEAVRLAYFLLSLGLELDGEPMVLVRGWNN